MNQPVKLGAGLATGMAYHAPLNTALPTYPTESLAAAWEEIGYISSDGITWAPGIDYESLKDWSNTIRRALPGEDPGTVVAPIISTTEESLKTVFGDDNVTVTEAATGQHGKLIKVDAAGGPAPAEAFLFIGKDGDSTFMVGTTNGVVTHVDDVVFVAGQPITWNTTIAGNWTYVLDEGEDD